MKTGWKLIRVMAGVPVVVGMCLTQGCYTESDETTPSAKTATTSSGNLSGAANMAVDDMFAPQHKHYVPKTRLYTVKANETISEIAKKEGVRWQDLLAMNPDLTLKSHLKKGQTLELPEAIKPVSSTHHAAVKHAAKGEKKPAVKGEKTEEASATAVAGEGTYTVKAGDSIAKIAKENHVKRADLVAANKLADPSKIKVGQKLVIPGKSEAAAPAVETAAPAAPATPVVEAPAAAPVAPAVPAVPGVVAPAPISAAPAGVAPAVGAAVAPVAVPAAADKTQNYTVKEGEDLYAVAIRWGVNPSELKAINNLTSTDLHAGQVLKIPVVSPTP